MPSNPSHKSTPGQSAPWLTLVLAGTAILIAAIPGAAAALELDLGALREGQLWRAVTGHFTHGSIDHLVWDVLALLLLGSLAEPHGRLRLALTTLIGAVAISVAFAVLRPELASYRGLSGIDSAWFGLVLARWWTRPAHGSAAPRGLALLAATLFVLKIGYEYVAQTTLLVDASAAALVVVPEAHLVGLAVGLVVGRTATGVRPRVTQPEPRPIIATRSR